MTVPQLHCPLCGQLAMPAWGFPHNGKNLALSCKACGFVFKLQFLEKNLWNPVEWERVFGNDDDDDNEGDTRA